MFLDLFWRGAVIFCSLVCGLLGAAPLPAQMPASKEPTISEPIRKPGLAGIENVIQLSSNIYSGGEPHGAAGFSSVAALGVKTIVSVDGARPNLAAAHAVGLKYVHIPIGYDGIADDARRALSRLVGQRPGPFYIHCHHGRHRGPAAAAVACIALGEQKSPFALRVLRAAGTSRSYVGLWRDVVADAPPKSGAPAPPLVEAAQVRSMVAAMAGSAHTMERLQLAETAGWKTPAAHPDVSPAHEALLLRESFHEMRRLLKVRRPAEFEQRLAEVEQQAQKLQNALASVRRKEATAIRKKIEQKCRACHVQYRNGS